MTKKVNRCELCNKEIEKNVVVCEYCGMPTKLVDNKYCNIYNVALSLDYGETKEKITGYLKNIKQCQDNILIAKKYIDQTYGGEEENDDELDDTVKLLVEIIYDNNFMKIKMEEYANRKGMILRAVDTFNQLKKVISEIYDSATDIINELMSVDCIYNDDKWYKMIELHFELLSTYSTRVLEYVAFTNFAVYESLTWTDTDLMKYVHDNLIENNYYDFLDKITDIVYLY